MILRRMQMEKLKNKRKHINDFKTKNGITLIAKV